MSKVRLASIFAVIVAAFVLHPTLARAQLTTVSTGLYKTPETISQAPSTFGSYGGDYFIPDDNLGLNGGPIWYFTPSGGPPSVFSSNLPYDALGGTFLPSSFGSFGGDYLVTGRSYNGKVDTGYAYAYNSSGVATELASVAGGSLDQPLIAPSSFGQYAGDIVVGDQINNTVDAISSTGKVSTITKQTPGAFGAAFAPTGFGSSGGDLFVDDVVNGAIYSVNSAGTTNLFATVPLDSQQTGLRQIAFSPANFIQGYGSLMFVSVSGSANGGGTGGDVYALDSSGKVVASLRDTKSLGSFDPRGLLFTGPGSLLISDAADPIDLATPRSFMPGLPPAPEASSMVSIGFVTIFALCYLRLTKRRRAAAS